MKNERFYQILSIALVIALVVCFVKIEGLKSDLNTLNNSIITKTDNLESKISTIYDNVDKQMKKEASLFSSTKLEYGELDTTTHKANISISVVPKTTTENMVAKVSVGDATVEMQKTGSEYTANLSVGLFEKHNTNPIVTLTANGETKTEYLEENNLSYIWSSYLPTMHGSRINPHKAGYSNGELTIDGMLEIGYSLSELSKDIKFVKYNLVAEVNNKEISNEDITKKVMDGIVDDANFGGDFTMDFNESYKMSEKDRLALYIVSEDSLGYIHKECAFSWVHPDENNAIPEPAAVAEFEGEVILDKEGNVLFWKGI